MWSITTSAKSLLSTSSTLLLPLIIVILSSVDECGARKLTKGHGNVSEYKDPIIKLLYGPGLSLEEIVKLESDTWHWYPWRHLIYDVVNDSKLVERECITEDSVDELPDDLFSQEQRRQGAVVLHFLAAIYFFTLLAVVCNDYFLPAVECICDDLHISEDVAAATFMSLASTTPEFFTNMISTFVADSDMGLGTIIGSMLFNTLGVAACASLASVKPVQLNWFPLTRDSIIFSINLVILVAMSWDGMIMWYETSILFALFIVYFCILFQNHRWEKYFRRFIETRCRWCRPREIKGDLEGNADTSGSVDEISVTKENNTKDEQIMASKKEETVEALPSLWKAPSGSRVKRVWWFYSWPIKAVLSLIIPSPRSRRRLYPLTFILCVLLIGVNSFMIYWMVAIIGRTFYIPESVMGLTLLACGGCLPEAISCVIIIRRGDGGFGVSNSLGANSLAILMSLGVPWFVKTMVAGAGSTGAHISILSYGIEFTITSLLLAVLTLYITVSLAKYRLRKVVGAVLITFYLIFITFAVLVELDVLFPSGNFC